MMNINKRNLFFYIRSLETKDNSLMRREIYDVLRSQSLLIKFIEFLYKFPFFKLIIMYLYGLICLGKITNLHNHKKINLWVRGNELNALRNLKNLEAYPFIQIKFQLTSLFNIFTKFKYLGVISSLSFYASKRNFINTLRTIEFLIFYQDAKLYQLENIRVSSDGTPALYGVIAAQDKAIIEYTPHGIVPPIKVKVPFHKLYFKYQYNLNFFKERSHGDLELINAEKSIYINEFKDKKNIEIGIALSIIPNIKNVSKLINKLEQLNYKVSVKEHPNMISKESGKQFNGNIKEDLKHVDLIICGNSGHIFTSFEQNKPVLYDNSLDFISNDIYQLVKNNLVYSGDLNLEGIDKFYQSESWKQSIKKWI